MSEAASVPDLRPKLRRSEPAVTTTALHTRRREGGDGEGHEEMSGVESVLKSQRDIRTRQQ